MAARRSASADRPAPDRPGTGRAVTVLRWCLLAAGAALLLATVTVGASARFAGRPVADGLTLAGPRTVYLTPGGGMVTHCSLRPGQGQPRRVTLQPLGRELLDGAQVTVPPGGARLTCSGGDVTVTQGPQLVLYPLAEHAVPAVIGGAVLVSVARFGIPRRRGR